MEEPTPSRHRRRERRRDRTAPAVEASPEPAVGNEADEALAADRAPAAGVGEPPTRAADQRRTPDEPPARAADQTGTPDELARAAEQARTADEPARAEGQARTADGTRARAADQTRTPDEPPARAADQTGTPDELARAAEQARTANEPARGAERVRTADEPLGSAAASKRKPRARRADAERTLRGIVGAGASQVGIVGAMRARDAARPTAEDIAAAERDLVVVRRHYVPPDALPGAR